MSMSDAPTLVLVWSHGRPSPTLLPDLLAGDPQSWATYEPLQVGRERPHDAWAFHIDGLQSCRDRTSTATASGKDNGAVSLASRCPLRDAALLLTLLRCNHMPLLTAWYGELDLTGQRAAYLPERLLGPERGRGAAWMATSYHAQLSNTRAAAALADERACNARPERIAKTIRLNGHLDAIFNVSRALGWAPPVVLHLVRDARAVYASRRRVNWTMEAKTVRVWARAVCGATKRDMASGRRYGAGGYEYIDHATLMRRPTQLVESLYRRHFRRPVPREVHAYIAKHFASARRDRRNGTGDIAAARRALQSRPSSWQFQYGTEARDVEAVEQRWQSELQPWERSAIEQACGSALEGVSAPAHGHAHAGAG